VWFTACVSTSEYVIPVRVTRVCSPACVLCAVEWRHPTETTSNLVRNLPRSLCETTRGGCGQTGIRTRAPTRMIKFKAIPRPILQGQNRGVSTHVKKHVRWDRRHPAHQNNPGTAQDTSLASVVSRKLFRLRCLNFGGKIAKFGDGIPPNPPKRQNVVHTPAKASKASLELFLLDIMCGGLENWCPIVHLACFLLCTCPGG
jgi:hypothetical protein